MRPWTACVRCGVKERHEGTFLCLSCLQSPVRQFEIRGVPNNAEGRRALMRDWGWHGGWDRQTLPDAFASAGAQTDNRSPTEEG